MAYSRPIIQDLITRIKQDLAANVSGVEPWYKGTFEYVLARVLARLAHSQHGHLDWVGRQIFPGTSDDPVFWAQAKFYGIFRKPASKWEGTYTFSGTALTVVPSGTVLESSAGGQYVTTDEVAIGPAGEDATAPIEAATGFAGSTYNLDMGAELTLVTPIAGIDSDGTVATSEVDGADLETRPEAYERLLQRIRTPPSGGGPGDYVRWSLEVAGFTRAWEYPKANGVGTVAVSAVRDGEDPIVPDAGERATLLAYLQTVAPVTVTVSVNTLVELEVDFEIALTPDTSEVRAAVETELTAMLQREGEPGTSIALSLISEAISAAEGETSHVLVTPSSPIVIGALEIPVLGTVTWS